MAGLPQVTAPFPGSRCPTSPLIIAGGVIPTRMPDVHIGPTSSGATQATSWGRGRQTEREGQRGLDRRKPEASKSKGQDAISAGDCGAKYCENTLPALS